MSFVSAGYDLLGPWVFAGPQITVINNAGSKLTFGGGTRVLVEPSEYWGLSYSSVSNTEAGTWSSILN